MAKAPQITITDYHTDGDQDYVDEALEALGVSRRSVDETLFEDLDIRFEWDEFEAEEPPKLIKGTAHHYENYIFLYEYEVTLAFACMRGDVAMYVVEAEEI